MNYELFLEKFIENRITSFIIISLIISLIGAKNWRKIKKIFSSP